MPSIRVLFNGEEIMYSTLNKEFYVIGRQEDCDIRIDNLGVSRNHARLMREGEHYYVEDLGSSNGTYVNGQTVQRHNLKDGDEITIGKYNLIYGVGQVVEEAPAESQESAPVSGGNVMDGSLNTMAMDGDAIRRRMEEIHKQQSSSEMDPVKAAEMQARQHELDLADKRAQMIKIISLVAVVVIVAIVALLLFK